MKLLDCTFRDGGYYNNWDFDTELAKNYLFAMGSSGVDVVEIGFRFTPKPEFIGAFGYSTDQFVRSLVKWGYPPLAVMVNGSDVETIPASDLFAPADASPITIVRVAVHYAKIKHCERFVKELSHLGYAVFINLMQTGGKSETEIIEATTMIASWNCVSVLYFADSIGDMSTKQVEQTVKILRKAWPLEIGFHAHNNKSQALANSLAAIETGADWVDSTILGMGRGAGNAQTEYMLAELSAKEPRYKTGSVFRLALEDFAGLQKQYGWGPGLLYYLSALNNIHPTYVQEMMSLGYDASQMLEGVEKLASTKSNSYSKSNLLRFMMQDGIKVGGSWSADKWVDGRDVLVVASGPGTEKYHQALERYIEKHDPFVLCLNANTDFLHETDAYASADHTRLLTEGHKYKFKRRPVLLPRNLVKCDLDGINVLDYGLEIKAGVWQFSSTGCVIPSMLTAAYAFAALSAGGAKRILLAGFDGYASHDHRQHEMNKVFELYNGPPIVAITPTSYSVKKASVFEPEFSG